MKKTHWFRNTLIVLVCCGIVGTVLAAVLFASDGGRTSASASVQFSFDGAAEGKAPNGYPFDVSGFTSDEVLEAALSEAGLEGTYTAEQLRDNLTVTGVYPEKIVEQMTKYVSLLDKDASSQAAVTDYRATQYTVTLYNDFDRNISASALKELVDAVMKAYRAYFTKTCTAGLDTQEAISDLPEYDYAQQLEAIAESNKRLNRYAEDMAELAPDFMVKKKGFTDIAMRYQELDSDIDRLTATVTFNVVSKDSDRLKKRYEMEIRTQQYQLDSLTEELKLVEEQVNAYDKDGIIYVSAGGSLKQVGSDETGTYDKLVEKRKELTDKISAIRAKIALYQGRLEDMTGESGDGEGDSSTALGMTDETKGDSSTALGMTTGETVEMTGEEDASAAAPLTEEEKAALQETVRKKIEALVNKKNAITADFAAMLEAYAAQEVNEKTVSVTAAKYDAPKILSGAFVVKALKTAGPICAVGFMVCMVLLIISRRKEEKRA